MTGVQTCALPIFVDQDRFPGLAGLVHDVGDALDQDREHFDFIIDRYDIQEAATKRVKKIKGAIEKKDASLASVRSSSSNRVSRSWSTYKDGIIHVRPFATLPIRA